MKISEKSKAMRIGATALSAVMGVALVPKFTGVKEVRAADSFFKNEANTGVVTSIIDSPKAPESPLSIWCGNYVWLGQFNGKPVKYRVLSPETTAYGGNTMFLDCNNPLFYMNYDSTSPVSNVWDGSDLQSVLNGDFYSGAFSEAERDAIAQSVIEGGKAYPSGSLQEYKFGQTVGLCDWVFVLDAGEALNPEYGYSSNPGVTTETNWETGEWNYQVVASRFKYSEIRSQDEYWWLRNASVFYSNVAGMIDSYGKLNSLYVDDEEALGVAPALNLNLESVILSTEVQEPYEDTLQGEYKLTLLDDNLSVSVTEGETVKSIGSTVYVPYTITGWDASVADHVTVMILNSEYEAGNGKNRNLWYYGALEGEFSTNGVGSFTLPSFLDLDGWNQDYYVYIMAEDVASGANALYESDYASEPVLLSAPTAKQAKELVVYGGMMKSSDWSIFAGLKNLGLITKFGNGYDVDKDGKTDFEMKDKQGSLYQVGLTSTCTLTGKFLIDMSRFTDYEYSEVIIVFSDDPTIYLSEIHLTGDVDSVQTGRLDPVQVKTETMHTSLSETADWFFWTDEHGSWYGFGDNVPVAVNDGYTHYGLGFWVNLPDGYKICDTTRLYYNDVLYNGKDNTIFEDGYWGALVRLDLGLASGTNVSFVKVTFDSRGGDAIDAQNVQAGTIPNKPTDPKRTGYWFAGWYTDLACTQEYKFEYGFDTDYTLYAKWDEADLIHEVRLYSDVSYAPIGVLPSYTGTSTTELIKSVESWGSLGWLYWTDAHGSWYGFGGETPKGVVDGETSYGMAWQVYVEDGYQIAQDAKVFLNDLEVTNVGHTRLQVAVKWGAYITIDVGAAKNGCTILFDGNGGSGTMPNAYVGEGDYYVLPESAFTPPEGKCFDKWDCGNVGDKIQITSSKTLKALWKDAPVSGIDMHVYDYYYETESGGAYNFYIDGTLAASTNGGCHGVTDGHVVTIEAIPATGKRFVAWYLDSPVTGTLLSDEITYTFTVNGDMTIYAMFYDEYYTLSYEANGGTTGEDWTPVATVAPHSSLICVPPPETFVKAPAGKEYAGFMVNGVEYGVGSTVELTGNTTIKYLWKDIECTITYDANGGITGEAWVDSVKVVYGTLVEVKAPTSSLVNAPEGKEFAGILINGVEYAIGSFFEVYADATIQYQWKDIEVTPGPDTPTPEPGPDTPTPEPGPDTPTPEPGPDTPTPEPGPDTPTPEPGKDPSFEDFVERLYTVALGRASEPEGKAYWVEQVVKNGFSGADCARFFMLGAPEFLGRNLTDDEFVEVLYKTYFDRDSEPDGKAYWMGRLASGTERAVLVEEFIESVEWCNVCAGYGVKSGAVYHKATVPSKNAVKFATRLYTCCLGRDPEEEGLQYWALALTNLEATGYQAASLFFTLPEFVGLKTTNEEYLTRLYTTFMGREPEAEGFAYWLGLLNGGTDRVDVMKAFAGCPEFQEICNQYGIVRGEI